MRLFKFENYQLNISPEALAIKAFRVLWDRDKTASKLVATQQLAYIYFMYDPRSDYMFIIDEDERHEQVVEQEGLPKDWKPDKEVQKAIDVYKFLITSPSSLLLQDTRALIDKVRKQLKEIDLTAVDDKRKPVWSLAQITSTIKQIPSLIQDLTNAEKAINSEIEENSKMRGSGVKKLFEDGALGFDNK